MGLGTATIKYILFFINFAFALSGLAVLGLGVWLRYYSVKAVELAIKNSGETYNYAALAFIIIGGFVFIVSFFGCCGAIQESHCMITLYAIFLLTILLLEVAIGAFLYVNRQKIEPITRESLTAVFNDYTNKTELREIHDIQSGLHCCGIDGPDDWASLNATSLPHSCCHDDAGQGSTCSKSDAWPEGCLHKIMEVVKSKSGVLLKTIAGIAGGELIGIIFALYLASRIRNEERLQGYA